MIFPKKRVRQRAERSLRAFLCLALLGFGGCSESIAPTIPHSWPIVAAGSFATCGLDNNGVPYCWGTNAFGALGNGTDTGTFLVPAIVSGNRRFAAVALGGPFACGLTTNGNAYCWGGDPFGELGDGTDSAKFAPVPVSTSLRFVALDAGQLHTCAITSQGAAYCWGRNEAGELGDNNPDSLERRTPVAVVGGPQFKSISAGEAYTCGVAVDGTAWCWGYNVNGELGDSLYYYIPFPVQVESSAKFQSVSAGWRHSCGVDTNGAGYCWGFGTQGELGNDSLGTFLIPQRVVGGHTYSFIGAGQYYSCGLATDQTAWCWGQGFSGELGSDSTYSPVPIPVSGGLHFTSLSVGQHYSCGIAIDHLAYCWGANGSGQLGDGSTSPSFKPTPIGGPLE